MHLSELTISSTPELYIFGGLPGSGKSTLAKHLAKTLGAVYLRIDSIEEAILANGELVGPEGYEVAYKLAGDNLDIGLSVVADSVNSIEITRAAWRKVANDLRVKYHEIEVVCSDKTEHRRRLESRESAPGKIRTVTWDDITKRQSQPWSGCIVFDTSGESSEENCRRFEKEIQAFRKHA
jgi:predicted kinase